MILLENKKKNEWCFKFLVYNIYVWIILFFWNDFLEMVMKIVSGLIILMKRGYLYFFI